LLSFLFYSLPSEGRIVVSKITIIRDIIWVHLRSRILSCLHLDRGEVICLER
jgi:hypothetical protein